MNKEIGCPAPLDPRIDQSAIRPSPRKEQFHFAVRQYLDATCLLFAYPSRVESKFYSGDEGFPVQAPPPTIRDIGVECRKAIFVWCIRMPGRVAS